MKRLILTAVLVLACLAGARAQGDVCPPPTGLALDWVDSTSARIVWASESDLGNWLMRIGGDDWFAIDTVGITLTDLEVDANVHVELRAVCADGDTSLPAVLDFHTLCGMKYLPLTEDFDIYRDDETPYCWTTAGAWQSGLVGYPRMMVNVFGVDAYLWLNNQEDGDTNGIVSPTIAPSDSVLRVSFSLLFTGPGTFVAGLMVHSDSAFHPIMTIDNAIGDNTGQMYWADYEFFTDTVTSVDIAQPFHVAFMWLGDSPVGIDNITLAKSGPCHAPTQAGIDTAWYDTVVLSWEDYSLASAGYEVRYGQSTLFDEADFALITDQNPVAIGGLEASVDYSFWVRALCPDDSARWLFVGRVHTECGPTGLPYVRNFDVDEYLPNGSVPCWETKAQTAASGIQNFPGTLQIYAAQGDTIVAATPILKAPADEWFVSVKVTGIGTEPVDVGVADDSLHQFIPLYTIYAGEGIGTHEFYTDELSISDTMRLAFRLQGSASTQSVVYIDELLVRQQKCRTPLQVLVDTVGVDEATIHISDPAEVGFYRIYLSHGEFLDSLDLTDTAVSLVMLESGVEYTVSVAAICYDGSLSATVSTRFRTYCPLMPHTDLPYAQDFDHEPFSAGANPEVGCWVISNYGSSYDIHPDDDGSEVIEAHLPAGGNSTVFALPGVDVVDDLLLRAKVKRETVGNVLIEVGVMTQPVDIATFVPIDTIDCPASGVWKPFEVYLGTYDGYGHWPALRITQLGGSQMNVVFDDFWLGQVPDCSGNVRDVVVSNVWSYSADVAWNIDIARNYDASFAIHLETGDGQPAGDFFVDSMHYTVYNLDALTPYRLWVEMSCGGDVQAVSDTVSFMTRCDNTQSIEQSAYSNHDSPQQWSFMPISASEKYSASQQLFTAAEFDDSPATLTAVDFRWCNDAAALEVVNCSVYLSPYYADTLTAWQTDGRVLVYSGPAQFRDYGWNTLYFSSPYEYDGVSNLLLTIVAEVNKISNGYTFGSYNAQQAVTLWYSSLATPFNDTLPVVMSFFRGETRFHLCPGDVPQCTAPVLQSVEAACDSIRMVYSAGGAMCETSISEGWRWHGDVYATDNSGDFSFAGLEPVTNYIVGVRRLCPGMTSIWATRVIRTMQIACDQPSAPVATDITSTSATLTFSPNGSEHWQLHVFNSRIDTIIDLADTVYHLAGLVPDVTYRASVRSRCGVELALESAWSDTVSFTTTYCHPVADATVVADGSTAAVVSWTDGSQGNTYRILYGLRGFVRGEEIASFTTTDHSLRIEGLEPGQMYDFYVAAVCPDGLWSVWSYAGGVPPLDIDGSAMQGEPRLVLQPNPASGSVNLGTEAPAAVSLFDVGGRTVMQTSTDGGTVVLDISALSQGTYFVRATTAAGSTVRKLIVR